MREVTLDEGVEEGQIDPHELVAVASAKVEGYVPQIEVNGAVYVNGEVVVDPYVSDLLRVRQDNEPLTMVSDFLPEVEPEEVGPLLVAVADKFENESFFADAESRLHTGELLDSDSIRFAAICEFGRGRINKNERDLVHELTTYVGENGEVRIPSDDELMKAYSIVYPLSA